MSESQRPRAINVAHTLASHAPSLRDCIDIVASDTHFLASVSAPSEQQLSKALQASRHSESVHMIATEDDRVVGWAQIDRGNGSSVSHRGDLGMGVLPSHRHLGLGRRLLSECIAAAHARGIIRVELEVRTDNHPAIQLYRAQGFSVESIVKMSMSIDGRYHNSFRMFIIADSARNGPYRL